jgi:diadenosine tetraphosphate (Ap4A) HIT family hydrolase
MACEHFEAHLLVAIGSEAYVALAKGPLTAGSCIVLPVTHASAAMQCPQETLAQLLELRGALGRCFAAEGLETVAFERQMGGKADETGRDHMHLQVVPVPKHVQPDAVRAGIESHGQRVGISFEFSADSSWPPRGVQPGEGYLWYQLPAGGGSLLHRMCAHPARPCARASERARVRSSVLARRCGSDS